MKAGKFKKQGSEHYNIDADFSVNMDIEGGEDLIEGNCTVTAVDKVSTNATNEILKAGSLAIGTGNNKGKLYIHVQAGTVLLSAYKITFKTGDTTTGEGWEKDVIMTIKEI